MKSFEVERFPKASVQAVWDVVADFAEHGRWIPMTRVHTDEPPVQVGWSFTASTGMGPMAFDDPMTITRWSPPQSGGPGAFSIRKTGALLAGWADVTVTPHPRGSRLMWREELRVRALGSRLEGMSNVLNGRMFARSVDLMVREAERRAGA